MVKIGFGSSIVNPPVGSSLVGYFENRISKGIKDDLYARCICFDDGERIFFAVSADFCWVEQALYEKLKNMISEKLCIKNFGLAVHATHTHTGPLTDYNDTIIYTEGFSVDPEYIKKLPSLFFNAVEQSYKARRDVSLGFGSINVPGISFIRRYKMKNGMVITNPVDRSQILEPSGSFDDTLNLMKVQDKNGRLFCIVINFPLHPDTVGGELISGDWPGILVSRITKYLGCNAIFFNGAAGDINHINPYDKNTRSSEIVERIVGTLFENIKSMQENIECSPAKHILFSEDKFKMPKRKITQEQIEQAKEFVKKYPSNNLRAIVGRSLLKQAEIKTNFLDNNVALLTIDRDMAAFFTSGEIFSSIGLKIKNLMDFKHRWVIENCNGHLGYIPDEKAFLAAEENKKIKEEFPDVSVFESIGMETSYETSPISCKLAPEAEQILISQFQELLRKHTACLG
ncbi:MAG TPA: neutral/alkaline non-lysosomal ceramidase N-terminal domain-containing protein [Candidatus Ratteibacteria bacterium]|nr:neutral/alkaline non-lysosomal ceramidase N-terminal domain-containing protein [Candidatus Ratteibacteria bacterium]